MEKKPKIPKQLVEDLEDISEIEVEEQKSFIDDEQDTEITDLRDEYIRAIAPEDASPSEISFICDMMKMQFSDEDD